MAVTILNFVLANTKSRLVIQAHAYLIRIKIENAEEKISQISTEIEGLLTEYEISPFTLSLIQAHFVAFNLKNPEQGRAIIKKALTYGWMIIRWRRLKWN
jgi:hypothetical protein